MRHSFFKYQYEQLPDTLVSSNPDPALGVSVVIPAYAEPNLVTTLGSLCDNHNPGVTVECLVVLNETTSADSKDKKVNENAFNQIQKYCSERLPDWFAVHVIYIQNIDVNIGGVGLVRKLGMDEASHRFRRIEQNEGIILSLDGDCTVSENYLCAVLKKFVKSPKMELLNIHFEHISDDSTAAYADSYELHLRYFINMQRYLACPFAYYTIGSSFAVRSLSYQLMGGMNKRQAGEDFYFIQKFAKKGSLRETGECTVYPSGRISSRVPFGTGRVVGNLMDEKKKMKTYHPASFFDLNRFLDQLTAFYDSGFSQLLMDGLPASISSFLLEAGWAEVCPKLVKNSASKKSFYKAFFQWFDAFRLMKFVHYCRENHYPDIEVARAVLLAPEVFGSAEVARDTQDLLVELRAVDRKRNYEGIPEMYRRYNVYQ